MDNAQSGTTYTVRSGDTLSGIALQFYGHASEWLQIYDANKAVIGNDPNLLRPGMVLTIPPGGVVSHPRTYTVRSGDTLSGIALQFYGHASEWLQIYDANKAVIGNDPNLLRPGMVLTIP